MRKRFLTVVMGLVLTVSMITGCGSSNSSDSSSNSSQSSASVQDSSSMDASSEGNSASSDNSQNTDSDAQSSENSNVVYGKVTKVSDNGKVTYEVLERDQNQPQMPQGSGAPDGKNGEKPQMPQGSGAPDGKNGEKPQMPQGSGAPDGKNGEKPQKPQGSGAPDGRKNGNSGMPGFKSTGKKSTLTVGDDTTVQKASMDQTTKDASVSDIKKGSIIEITYDGDNVSKVTIRENSSKGGMDKNSQTSDNTNSTK